MKNGSENRGGRGGQASKPPADPKKHTPQLNKAWKLAKEQGKCPHHQKDLCTYGDDCRDPHGCVICGSKDHGACNCPHLHKEKGQKLLGP